MRLSSRFRKGQTVRATMSIQGLQESSEYQVVDVRTFWILGQGYTDLTLQDKAGKQLEIGNPQLCLEITRQDIETLVSRFFRQRFERQPEHDPGYFREWLERFHKGTAEQYFDEPSADIWRRIEQTPTEEA